MKIIPGSLLSRFFLIIVLPIVTAQFFVLYIFYNNHWVKVSNNMNYSIINEINMLVSSFSDDNFTKQDNYFTRAMIKYCEINYRFLEKNDADISSIFSHDLTENLVLNNREELISLSYDLAKKINFLHVIKYSRTEKRVLIFFDTNNADNKILEISFPSSRILSSTVRLFILWAVILNLLVIFVAMIFGRNQIRSILDLAKAMDCFRKGVAYEFKTSGAKEIRLAGNAFIRMRERIERNIQKRTQMLAMISHDLRTPLTKMRLQLDLLDDNLKDEVKDIYSDIADMEHLINDYLAFAGGEGGEPFAKVNIFDFLTDFFSKNNEHGLLITLNLHKMDIYCNIKPKTFSRAIQNIINNANKFATCMEIRLLFNDYEALMEFEDNGLGIDDENKEKVFKPFFSISDKKNAVGLGLSIVQEIVMGHGGSVSLHDGKNLGGLMVKLSIPVLS